MGTCPLIRQAVITYSMICMTFSPWESTIFICHLVRHTSQSSQSSQSTANQARIFLTESPLDTSVPPRPSKSPLLPYAIIPTFLDWPYPQEKLPPLWEQYEDQSASSALPSYGVTDPSGAVKSRDRTCRLTDSSEALQVAHIIPVQEVDWYNWNSMQLLGPNGNDAIDSPANNFLLRSDIHRLYDDHRWFITPKLQTGKQSASLTCHLGLNPTAEITRLYHNAIMHNMEGLSVHYLTARFALAIFRMLNTFLISGHHRRLKVRLKSTGRFETQTYDQEHLRTLYEKGSRARSVSPKKQTGNASPAKRPYNHTSSALEEAIQRSGDITSAGVESQQRKKRKRSSSSSSSIDAARQSKLSKCFELDPTVRPTPPLDEASSSPPPPTLPHVQAEISPCTCPPDGPISPVSNPASAYSTNVSKERGRRGAGGVWCSSPACRRLQELLRLADLRDQGLRKERARSDRGGQWAAHVNWARDPNTVMSSAAEMKRWAWVMGAEEDKDREGRNWYDNDDHIS